MAVITLSGAWAAEPAANADTPPRITEAERRLFKVDHLRNVKPPQRLSYRFERRGSLEPTVDDQATETVTLVDGKRVATVDFLHDDRRIELPPVDDVEGNPILLHFLERELREMNRLTGGSRSYYRKRIRMALAADPALQDITIEHDGKSIPAQRIRIEPYRDDPARDRYPRFAGRFYTMILSPQIPGEIYQLRAELMEPVTEANASTPLQSEVLTFENAQ